MKACEKSILCACALEDRRLSQSFTWWFTLCLLHAEPMHWTLSLRFFFSLRAFWGNSKKKHSAIFFLMSPPSETVIWEKKCVWVYGYNCVCGGICDLSLKQVRLYIKPGIMVNHSTVPLPAWDTLIWLLRVCCNANFIECCHWNQLQHTATCLWQS